MSDFVKDRDAHTRGVNAIAAVDGVGSRLRQREALKAAAMNARDRQMAQMANNAFRPQRHPLAQLGAVSLGPKTAFQQYSGSGIDVKGTSYAPTVPGGSPGTVTPRPTYTQPTSTVTATSTSWLSSSRLPSGTSRTPGTVTAQPSRGTSTPTVTTSSGNGSGAAPKREEYKYPGSSGGGGGGSSATSGGGWQGMPPTDEDALTDLVDSPSASVATPATGKKKMNYLLIAGVALGAYLLFKKKG